jgi:hypothetical protein
MTTYSVDRIEQDKVVLVDDRGVSSAADIHLFDGLPVEGDRVVLKAGCYRIDKAETRRARAQANRLLHKVLNRQEEAAWYSPVEIKTLPFMRIAQSGTRCPKSKSEALDDMEKWAKKSGLLDWPGYSPRRIGWDIAKVSPERRGRGYVAAYVLPENFVPACSGAEIVEVAENSYAVLTVTQPHINADRRIAGGYRRLFAYVQNSGRYVLDWPHRIAFEETYERDGVSCMDIHVPVRAR